MPRTVLVDIPGGKAAMREKVQMRGAVKIQSAISRSKDDIAKLPVAGLAKSASPFNYTPEQIEGLFDVNTQLIVAYLVDWDLADENGMPVNVPKTVDEVEELEPDLFNILGLKAWEIYATGGAPPKVDVEDAGDPDSPTEPSAASKQPSGGEGPSSESSPTPSSSSDGTPTSTDNGSQE